MFTEMVDVSSSGDELQIRVADFYTFSADSVRDPTDWNSSLACKMWKKFPCFNYLFTATVVVPPIRVNCWL